MTAERLVLEPDGLPDVPRHPAPWTLHGSGYVVAIQLPEALIDEHAFVPPSLAGKRHGHTGYLMLLDHRSSNCGPYRELLIAPASFHFPEGSFCSITRIFASTYESAVNARLNWGIPKDRADFAWQASERGDRVRVSRDDRMIADLSFSHHGLGLPVHSGVLPAGLRTVVQHWCGRQYAVTLRAKGTLRMAKLLEAKFDPALFPDLSEGEVIACGYLKFEMTFPIAVERSIAD